MNIPTLPDRETRVLISSVELRSADEAKEKRKVFGYAAKFNSLSENLGDSQYQFREIIQPGAFDDVLEDDVRALFNHDANMILARSKNGNGTLKIGTDAIGLWYEFEAPDTQAGRDLLTSIDRGDVDQSSFGFSVAKDGQKWEEKREGDGPTIVTRTITKVARLFDVSPVTYPAYPEASVALRSLQEFRQDQTPNDAPERPSQEEISEVAEWAARLGINPAQPTNQK